MNQAIEPSIFEADMFEAIKSHGKCNEIDLPIFSENELAAGLRSVAEQMEKKVQRAFITGLFLGAPLGVLIFLAGYMI